MIRSEGIAIPLTKTRNDALLHGLYKAGLTPSQTGSIINFYIYQKCASLSSSHLGGNFEFLDLFEDLQLALQLLQLVDLQLLLL